MYRTHDCNSLRKSDIGREVMLAGWINVTRDHGGVIFIDLRDREGLTQVVFRPEENAELAKQAHALRGEDVIQISGRVAARLPGTENPNLATGDIDQAAAIASQSLVLSTGIGSVRPAQRLRAIKHRRPARDGRLFAIDMKLEAHSGELFFC